MASWQVSQNALLIRRQTPGDSENLENKNS